MKLVILKTNIQTKQNAGILNSVFHSYTQITDWSIDTEDVDKVLRIEIKNNLDQNEIIRLIKTTGFFCEELED